MGAEWRLDGMRMRSSSRSEGFTLVEIMVALGVLAFGLLSVTAGHLMAMRVSTTSRSGTLALHLAQEQMETFRAMSAADVIALSVAPGYPNDPSNPIDPDPSDSTAMAFNRRWLIVPDSPEAGVISIVVEVTWLNPLGDLRTTRVASLKADDT